MYIHIIVWQLSVNHVTVHSDCAVVKLFHNLREFFSFHLIGSELVRLYYQSIYQYHVVETWKEIQDYFLYTLIFNI